MSGRMNDGGGSIVLNAALTSAAAFRLDEAEGGLRLALSGDWTVSQLDGAPHRLVRAIGDREIAALDVSDLGHVDTAGAFVLIREAGLATTLFDGPELAASRPDLARLARLVEGEPPEPPHAERRTRPLMRMLVRVGMSVEELLTHAFLTLAFYGELLTAVWRLVSQPTRLRMAPTFSLMERAGLDALPIVAATNFFVGATIAFLGTNLLAQFGASIFTVELVGVGVLREFGVLITAVILAGRSASSFAAEIGAMRMNQEIDAMEVMGVEPFDALVLPRFIAMLTMMPLLTFAAMIAGMAGGLLVIWAVINLSPALFLSRIVENVGLRHFWIGMVKAPVMAVVIAAIGCRQGLEVGGDVEQLGRRVTTAVVQALFAIIVIDALFALLFMELNL